MNFIADFQFHTDKIDLEVISLDGQSGYMKIGDNWQSQPNLGTVIPLDGSSVC